VFPGNGKSKTLPVQKVYFIHFTTPGTNEEDYPQNWRARQEIQYSSFQHKIEGIICSQFPDCTVKACASMAELVGMREFIVQLWDRLQLVWSFCDDTNNNKFETTIDFVKMAWLHEVKPCGSKKALLSS